MKKSDLKDGMIVELRNGDMCIVLNGKLLDTRDFTYLTGYSNDLTDLSGLNRLDIVKVYKDKEMHSLEERYAKNKLELIWERKEIDWSKVPFGTEVRVWNKKDDIRLVGRFLGYNEKAIHKYCVFVDITKPKVWSNCELMEETITCE